MCVWVCERTATAFGRWVAGDEGIDEAHTLTYDHHAYLNARNGNTLVTYAAIGSGFPLLNSFPTIMHQQSETHSIDSEITNRALLAEQILAPTQHNRRINLRMRRRRGDREALPPLLPVI